VITGSVIQWWVVENKIPYNFWLCASTTRGDTSKVTINDLYEVTYAFSIGTKVDGRAIKFEFFLEFRVI